MFTGPAPELLARNNFIGNIRESIAFFLIPHIIKVEHIKLYDYLHFFKLLFYVLIKSYSRNRKEKRKDEIKYIPDAVFGEYIVYS